MAADMDPEEMEEWRTIFNLFDVDGDESITCEVGQMGENLEPKQIQIKMFSFVSCGC